MEMSLGVEAGHSSLERKGMKCFYLFQYIYHPIYSKRYHRLKTSLYRLIYNAMWYIFIYGTKYFSCKQNLDPISAIQKYLKNKTEEMLEKIILQLVIPGG